MKQAPRSQPCERGAAAFRRAVFRERRGKFFAALCNGDREPREKPVTPRARAKHRGRGMISDDKRAAARR